MVRSATPADRPRVVALLKEFHAAAACDYAFDPVRAAMQFTLHLSGPTSCVLVTSEVTGFVMATAFDHPYGAGMMAGEAFLFVSPEARGRTGFTLIDAYEAWAREQGCAKARLTSLAGNDVSAIYLRRGYQPAETHFIKVL